MKLFLLKQGSFTGRLTTLEQKRFQDFLNSMDLIDGPSKNLAEVVHTGWKNSHVINLSLLRCAYEDIKCSLYIKQWMKDLESDDCKKVMREKIHFHHKTKIRFIFSAELVILILGKNVQRFYERANYTFSPIKCFIFFFVL